MEKPSLKRLGNTDSLSNMIFAHKKGVKPNFGLKSRFLLTFNVKWEFVTLGSCKLTKKQFSGYLSGVPLIDFDSLVSDSPTINNGGKSIILPITGCNMAKMFT